MDYPSSSFRLDLQAHTNDSDSETRNSVFILSDSRLIRDTLATSLRQELNSTHIHCVASFAEAVTRLDIAEPGIVVIDARLRDGLSATKGLHLRAQRTFGQLSWLHDEGAVRNAGHETR